MPTIIPLQPAILKNSRPGKKHTITTKEKRKKKRKEKKTKKRKEKRMATKKKKEKKEQQQKRTSVFNVDYIQSHTHTKAKCTAPQANFSGLKIHGYCGGSSGLPCCLYLTPHSLLRTAHLLDFLTGNRSSDSLLRDRLTATHDTRARHSHVCEWRERKKRKEKEKKYSRSVWGFVLSDRRPITLMLNSATYVATERVYRLQSGDIEE